VPGLSGQTPGLSNTLAGGAGGGGDGPTAPKRRSLERYVDQTSRNEKDVLDCEFARAVYESGLPLSTFNTTYWTKFFKTLRPSYQPPSPYFLSGPLLDKEYTKAISEMNEKIQSARALGIMTDSFTNTNGDSVIDVIITTPYPVLYRQVYRKQNRETAGYVGGILISVIVEVGEQKFFLLVTDNAANMKAAWLLVTERFPHITAVGCAAHCWNLQFKDLFENIPKLDIYNKRCRKIVNFVKNSSNVLAVFKLKQADKYGKKCISLKLPSKTRWGGCTYCY